MKADFLRDSQAMCTKMSNRLGHAKTKMEAAQKEHADLLLERDKMHDEHALEKEKLDKAMQLLDIPNSSPRQI